MSNLSNPNIEVPQIETISDLQEYVSGLYVINKYWESKEIYNQFQNRIRNIMRGAIDKKELREYPIKFKFYESDTPVHELQLRRFLYNVYIWYPFCEIYGYDGAVTEDCIIEPEQIPKVNDFLYDHITTILEKYRVKQTHINRCMADVTYMLSSISLDFSFFMGLHFEEYHFQKLYENEEVRKMIECTFSSEMQPFEIESQLNAYERRLIEIIVSDPTNPIGVILRAKTGMKTKQLREFMIAIGLRPSLTGEVITTPIENGLLVNGLNKPSYMYIDALGARKPLLANNKDMGPVGYFGKTLNLAVRTLEVSREIVDCETPHYVTYDVKSEQHLKLLVGKWYYDEESDELSMIQRKDTKFIGKKIKVRSAVTCCCGQNKVCPTCIGNIINLNWDISEGFSTFITEEYSKNVEQNVLSTKHLLTTKSERIEFSPEFHRLFRLDGEEIKFLDDVKDVKDLTIMINPEEIKKVEEFDPNSTYNTYIDTGRFQILNEKTGEIMDVSVKNGKKLFIRTETSSIMDVNDGTIPLKDIEEDQAIFEVCIENNELVKPFYDLIALLDTENRDMDDITIDNLSQRFLDIFVEAGLDVSIAAGELALNRLCRKPDNCRKRPNFGKKKLPDYHFFALSKIVEENGSPTVGLTFEQLLRQMTRLDIDERNDTSYMDPLFREDVSTEPLMKERRMLMIEESEHVESD